MFCCFNRKTAYEIRISDWSSDVCSSDLAENIPSGDPFDPAVASGPVVNQAAVDRILGMIDRAKSEGETLLAGGNRVDREGYYIEPTVFTDVDPDSAQNGRASCRERRCPYVYISDVAGEYEKTKKPTYIRSKQI